MVRREYKRHQFYTTDIPKTEENEQNSEQNFEKEEENDGNEQNPETEMNDLPDLAPESEPEEESEEEYYESSDEEINRPERKNRTVHDSSDEEIDEQKISDNAQEINRPVRKNRTVHDYSKLNKNGTTVIGNIRPEETEIKKGRRNVKISIIGNTIKVEKKETEKEKKSHKTLIKRKYPKAYEIRIPKNRREMLKSEYKEEFLIAEKIDEQKISDKAQENNRPERKNRTVHDYSKLNKYGTTVIGNIRPEETEIKKGRRNVKISII